MVEQDDSNETVQLRIRDKTAQQLRYIYAMTGEKMIDIVAVLVDKEYERLMEKSQGAGRGNQVIG